MSDYEVKENELDNEFVPKDLAVKALRAGFNKQCFAIYRGLDLESNLSLESGLKARETNELAEEDMPYWAVAPLWQQLDSWFKVEHKIFMKDNFHQFTLKTLTEQQYLQCRYEQMQEAFALLGKY